MNLIGLIGIAFFILVGMITTAKFIIKLYKNNDEDNENK